MPRWFLILSLPLLLMACSTGKRPPLEIPEENLDLEEQAIYLVLLSDYHGETIVLSETTDSGFEFRGQTDMPGGMPGLSEDLWKDYLARNDKAYPLSRGMEVGVEYVLIDTGEMSEIFNDFEDGWEEFYNRYPGSPGITTLSRAGFNQEGTEALVYMGAQFHYLAGAGNLYRLEKQDGVWKIVDKVMLWIS